MTLYEMRPVRMTAVHRTGDLAELVCSNSFRSDDVDFQRGELEWGEHNIYFDKYSYHFEVKEVKPHR